MEVQKYKKIKEVFLGISEEKMNLVAGFSELQRKLLKKLITKDHYIIIALGHFSKALGTIKKIRFSHAVFPLSFLCFFWLDTEFLLPITKNEPLFRSLVFLVVASVFFVFLSVFFYKKQKKNTLGFSSCVAFFPAFATTKSQLEMVFVSMDVIHFFFGVGLSFVCVAFFIVFYDFFVFVAKKTPFYGGVDAAIQKIESDFVGYIEIAKKMSDDEIRGVYPYVVGAEKAYHTISAAASAEVPQKKEGTKIIHMGPPKEEEEKKAQAIEAPQGEGVEAEKSTLSTSTKKMDTPSYVGVVERGPKKGQEIYRELKESLNELLTGSTRSGKTTYVKNRISERLAKGDTIFYTAEPKPHLAKFSGNPDFFHTTNPEKGLVYFLEILDEFERRSALLAEKGVESLWDLPKEERPKIIYLIVDEFESFWGECEIAKKEMNRLMAMGTKLLIGGIVITQTLRAKEVPSYIQNNIASKTCFRVSDGYTARFMGAKKAVDILEQEKGLAIHNKEFVQCPPFNNKGGFWDPNLCVKNNFYYGGEKEKLEKKLIKKGVLLSSKEGIPIPPTPGMQESEEREVQTYGEYPLRPAHRDDPDARSLPHWELRKKLGVKKLPKEFNVGKHRIEKNGDKITFYWVAKNPNYTPQAGQNTPNLNHNPQPQPS